MKNKKIFFLSGLSTIALVMIFIISCKKETPEALASVCGNGICDLGESNLTCPGDCPAASNTINFTANVNGSSYSAIAYGLYLTNPDYMVITASDDSTASYDIIKIGLHSFTGVATYTLNEANYSTGTNSWAYYTTGLAGGFYIYCTNTFSPYIGTCTITKFDTTNKKVSGTFNYSGKYSYWQQASCGTCDSNMVYTVSGSFTDVGY